MNRIRDILERKILPLVQKPGRYIGGEFGIVRKTGADLRIALAFPDLYEIGMSHLGLKILYSIVNGRPGFAAERVFAPWPDMERLMRRHGVPLYGLESFTPLGEFDIVGFSLPHELTYTNILTMLDLSGIPIHVAGRADRKFPLVIAGGPGAYNPGPLEEFIDIFVVGEGEEVLIELMELVRELRGRGEASKPELLAALARGVRGVYVPSLYRRVYDANGRLLRQEPVATGVPDRVKKRVVPHLNSARHLEKIPVPHIGIVHDRVGLEVRRGCTQGCRFCQAGMIYRPVRDAVAADICGAAATGLNATGYDEVALCALSVGDYPALLAVARGAREAARPWQISVSLPSLRPDALARGLAEVIAGGRRSGITLAPEAGTDRLRRRINKNISIPEMLQFTGALRERGWRLVKLYFMIGLPGETEDDLKGIADTIATVAAAGGRKGGHWEVNVTISSFIPKPHTPFAWDPMEGVENIREKQRLLRRLVRGRNINMKFHDCESSVIEAAFSRGDPRLSRVLAIAWLKGCRFDSWKETFSPALWREAFAEAGLDPAQVAQRRFGDDELFPWECIDPGVSREFLLAERTRATECVCTPDCATGECVGCGVCESLKLRPDPCKAG
ncbi:MAG: TIGR03960 family B12-binding radical SAM protein [Candidatus Aureabacteria bacterium]|nr:TIGR03960 family B12-binding radical SAM protein [Candidatus Auribacterota bacterium]